MQNKCTAPKWRVTSSKATPLKVSTENESDKNQNIKGEKEKISLPPQNTAMIMNK